MELTQHKQEMEANKLAWLQKENLRKEYKGFYKLLLSELAGVKKTILEIGSGMGNIKTVIPQCATSERIPNPNIDRLESAYKINADNESIGALIYFDVWHHLEYPGQALQEAHRVLEPGGRVLLMEPAMSPLGTLIYGLFHHEPLGWKHRFNTDPVGEPENEDYFAAQASAWRLFVNKEYPQLLAPWNIRKIKKITALAYAASGGFSKPQLYPDWAYPHIKTLETLLPASLCATRLMVVLEKQSS